MSQESRATSGVGWLLFCQRGLLDNKVPTRRLTEQQKPLWTSLTSGLLTGMSKWLFFVVFFFKINSVMIVFKSIVAVNVVGSGAREGGHPQLSRSHFYLENCFILFLEICMFAVLSRSTKTLSTTCQHHQHFFFRSSAITFKFPELWVQRSRWIVNSTEIKQKHSLFTSHFAWILLSFFGLIHALLFAVSSAPLYLGSSRQMEPKSSQNPGNLSDFSGHYHLGCGGAVLSEWVLKKTFCT